MTLPIVLTLINTSKEKAILLVPKKTASPAQRFDSGSFHVSSRRSNIRRSTASPPAHSTVGLRPAVARPPAGGAALLP